jgi:TolA-binding protein
MSTENPLWMMIVQLAALAITSGCDNSSSQVARVAQEAAQRQAEQNQEMAHLNRDVAEATKRLVEGQAAADQQWQTTERKIHEQQDQLEAERRQQADTRQHDSLLAPVLWSLGVLVVCCLPLLVCWQLLTGLAKETQEATITQFLVDEVIGPSGIAPHPGDARSLLEEPRPSANGIDSPLALLPGDQDEGQGSCPENHT